MSNIEKIRQEIDTRRQHMVEELMGHEENCEYHRIKGMHDAYVDLLTFLDYSLSEEKPSDELEEAAEHCVWNSIDSNDPTLVPKFIPLLLSLFISGAYWQKEQMMKDAVEGEIVKDITNKLAVTAKNINLDGFKFGDKVKIIIVKED